MRIKGCRVGFPNSPLRRLPNNSSCERPKLGRFGWTFWVARHLTHAFLKFGKSSSNQTSIILGLQNAIYSFSGCCILNLPPLTRKKCSINFLVPRPHLSVDLLNFQERWAARVREPKKGFWLRRLRLKIDDDIPEFY